MSNEKSVTREWQAGAPAKESSAGGASAPAGAATPAGSPGAAPGRSAGSPLGPGTQPTQAVRSWYTPTTAHDPHAPPHDPHAPAEPHSGSTRAGGPGVPPELLFVPDTELFTRITPGFILETIPREQAVMLSTSRLFPQSAEHAPEEFTEDMSRALARRMLAALPAEDLRAVCRRLHLPSEGEFMDLYRRLSLLC